MQFNTKYKVGDLIGCVDKYGLYCGYVTRIEVSFSGKEVKIEYILNANDKDVRIQEVNCKLLKFEE